MQDEKLYKDSRKEVLYGQLLTSLEGGNRRAHVICVDPDETEKEAKERYLKETGASIGANDTVWVIILVSAKEKGNIEEK